MFSGTGLPSSTFFTADSIVCFQMANGTRVVGGVVAVVENEVGGVEAEGDEVADVVRR